MGEEPQRIAFLKYFRVFNIADVENITISIPEVILQEHKKITQCETIIHSHHNRPAFVFEDANRAYYNPVKDCINMPAIEQFTSAEEYYSCFFHELVHSTGHASRLNRKGITQPNSFGSKDYSKEELIAEIGASFLCAHTSIDRPEIVENSAAYLQGWLSVLKADKKLIFKAAAAAQKAVNFLLEDVPANP
jgi:antirestriction protein ArdC